MSLAVAHYGDAGLPPRARRLPCKRRIRTYPLGEAMSLDEGPPTLSMDWTAQRAFLGRPSMSGS